MPIEHYCHCGAWGAFGEGVNIIKGKPGTWYCREHWKEHNAAEQARIEKESLSVRGPLSNEGAGAQGEINKAAPEGAYDPSLFAPLDAPEMKAPAKPPLQKRYRVAKRKGYDLLEVEGG